MYAKTPHELTHLQEQFGPVVDEFLLFGRLECSRQRLEAVGNGVVVEELLESHVDASLIGSDGC